MPRPHNDPDNPPLTASELASARRGIDHLPEGMQKALRRGRGPQKAPTKELVSIRLSRPVLAAYRSTGKGWQARVNADLEVAAKKISRTIGRSIASERPRANARAAKKR